MNKAVKRLALSRHLIERTLCTLCVDNSMSDEHVFSAIHRICAPLG